MRQLFMNQSSLRRLSKGYLSKKTVVGGDFLSFLILRSLSMEAFQIKCKVLTAMQDFKGRSL